MDDTCLASPTLEPPSPLHPPPSPQPSPPTPQPPNPLHPRLLFLGVHRASRPQTCRSLVSASHMSDFLPRGSLAAGRCLRIVMKTTPGLCTAHEDVGGGEVIAAACECHLRRPLIRALLTAAGLRGPRRPGRGRGESRRGSSASRPERRPQEELWRPGICPQGVPTSNLQPPHPPPPAVQRSPLLWEELAPPPPPCTPHGSDPLGPPGTGGGSWLPLPQPLLPGRDAPACRLSARLGLRGKMRLHVLSP